MTNLIVGLVFVLVIGGIVTFVILSKKKRDAERKAQQTVQSGTIASAPVDESDGDSFCLGKTTKVVAPNCPSGNCTVVVKK